MRGSSRNAVLYGEEGKQVEERGREGEREGTDLEEDAANLLQQMNANAPEMRSLPSRKEVGLRFARAKGFWGAIH